MASYVNIPVASSGSSTTADDNSFDTLATRAFGSQPFIARTVSPVHEFNRLEKWTGASSANADLQTRQWPSLRMHVDGNGTNKALYYKVLNSGIALNDPTTSGKFSQHGGPASMPWALRMTAMFDPADVMNAGHAGLVYIIGWAGSDSGINGTGLVNPGSGGNGGSVALVYTSGGLQIRQQDATPQTNTLTVTGFSSDNKMHIWDLWFDGQAIKVTCDSVDLTPTQPMNWGTPESGAYLFFGCDSGGITSGTGAQQFLVHQLSYAVPAITV